MKAERRKHQDKCGYCSLAESVKGGTSLRRLVDGETVEIENPLDYLAERCRCDLLASSKKFKS
jgi:hypothetical protein